MSLACHQASRIGRWGGALPPPPRPRSQLEASWKGWGWGEDGGRAGAGCQSHTPWYRDWSGMDLMMYSTDKMMQGKSPLPISGPGPCFPGRYSPTYRTPPDPMRRCMTNPSVSTMLSYLYLVTFRTSRSRPNYRYIVKLKTT